MQWWNNLHTLTKIALICFILGKFHFIPAVLTIFAAYEYSLFFIVMYSVFIAAAAFLSLVRIKQLMKESKNDDN
tara:strand:+ start:933 stop:1154 length:222 start_codon:yes stop_codon:yes gene_type:complete